MGKGRFLAILESLELRILGAHTDTRGFFFKVIFILLSVLILSHQIMAHVSLLSADDLTGFLLMIWVLYITQPEDRS